MNHPKISKQSGSVLAISLVLLAAITLIAVMNMQRSGIQTRITSNILHREELFNNAMNEQESWFFLLKTADTGDELLSDPMRSFNFDANGARIYLPVPLNKNNASGYTEVTNQLLLLNPPTGSNALAEGQESGDRILFRYELQSQAGIANRIQGRSMTETQITGMSFPGLNTGKNSLYAPP
ncbi:hypothetical protein A9R00_10675 [Oleispira antarctica]|uniref:Type 4 fimbrial biogenesis protein PilX N-terminal domain-containing protein n=1 Tax=Oleispira antarctica TaxID=188908 RepID=A0A1Y5HQU1_OLEAN|nr:hypothetical protein A9R00_10675 [Oleispira antarctica]